MVTVRRPLLIGWRAAVAACGLIGWAGDWQGLKYLSQLSSLAVALYFGWLVVLPLVTRGRRVFEPDPFVRMTICAATWLVGIVFATLLDADYSYRQSLFMHAVVPVATAADALAVSGNLTRIRWRHVALLPLGPLIYLAFALPHSPPLYPFLTVHSAEFWPTIVGALFGIWLTGSALLVRGRVATSQ